jgi:5'-phosphate synthase pdxT subunit
MKPLIGVLALQGGVSEHIDMFSSIGCSTIGVRRPEHLALVNGFVIPGGESTAIMKLLARWDLISPVKELAYSGVPMWGTCAGSVVLSSEICEKEHAVNQPCLGLAPVRAERNSFGRQVASFQENLIVKGLDLPFPGIFIRAPLLHPLSDSVEVLCSVQEGAVFLRAGNIWLCSFHPELTGDSRIHSLFAKEALIGPEPR